MRKILWQLNLIFLLVVLGSGCASNNYHYHYREASYDKKVEKGTILHALWFPPGIEDKILALDPGYIEETDIREVLARGPAPRIINIYGAYYGVHLSMISFTEFLIGMRYPETKIRNPRDGTYGYRWASRMKQPAP